MVRWLAVALALVVLSGVVAPVATAADAGTSGPRLATQNDFDTTEFIVTAHGNGSARWTFRHRRTLANETDRNRFESFAEEFNANETDLYRNFRRRASALTRSGSNVTGRDMAARSFSREAFVESGLTQETDQGVVEMSFLWTNFAPVDGDRVVVRDVFEGGLYIASDQRLVLQRGPEMAFVSVDPEPDASSTDSRTWEGERQFNDERPRAVLAPRGSVSTETTTGGSGSSTGEGLLPVFLAGFVVLLGIVAAVAWRAGMVGSGVDPSAGGDAANSADGGGAAGADTGSGASAVGTAGTDTADAADTEPAVPDEELISDEDRVLSMLEGNGGRMKQVDIVDETGWSKSKVSMLLSDMEEEGEISKLRVGRENIISLKGNEPEAAGSPFDDEDDE